MLSWLTWKRSLPITSFRSVTWLVTYGQYYRELEKLLGKLARKGRHGYEIFIAAWRLDIDTPLNRDNLQDLLRGAVSRGVRLRALVSGHTEKPAVNDRAVTVAARALPEEGEA